MRRKALSILICLMMLFLVIPNEKIKGDNPPDGPNEPNVWPSADFFWLTPFPDEGESIKFDASISEDPDGNITKYEWDFDADGTYEENNSRIVYHSWDEAGNYTVRLRVTDDDNATAVKEKVVRVYKKLDLDFIMNVTRELSNIVNKTGCERGRCFGTEGERNASLYIKDWMSATIGLEDVTEEKINKSAAGYKLNEKRVIQDWYLHIIVENISGGSEPEWEVNLTKDDDRCFPIMNWYKENTSRNIVPIVNKIDEPIYKNDSNPTAWLLKVNETDSYNWVTKACRKKDEGCFIVMDCYNKTKFMTQTLCFPVVGFSVTGDIGNKILYYLLRNYTVKAKYYQYHTYETVESYNVYGDISANNNNSTVIVGAHYDSWWGQCAVDNAIGTAIMLGIAKYFKENNFTGDKLKRGLRFIAFAGEEWPPYPFCRGSRDYVKKHGNESNFCMINIDMVASKDGNLTVHYSGTREDVESIKDIVGIDCNLKRGRSESDDQSFPLLLPTVSFGSEEYNWYHRDGKNHTEGDVMRNIDWNKAKKIGKFVLEIVKYYTLKGYEIPEVLSNVSYLEFSSPPKRLFIFEDAPPQENSTNFIPYIPHGPSPENGSQNVSVNTTLSWFSGDFDADNVTYKISIKEGDALPCVFTINATVVPMDRFTLHCLIFKGVMPDRYKQDLLHYFGINVSNKTTVVYRYKANGHAIDYVEYKISLQYNTTYEWQVTACDEHGAIATSKTWKFTTIAE